VAAAIPHLIQTLRNDLRSVEGVDPFAPGKLPQGCETGNSVVGREVAKVAGLIPYPELASALSLKNNDAKRRKCGAQYNGGFGSRESVSVLRDYYAANRPDDSEIAKTLESSEKVLSARDSLLSFAMNTLARQTFGTMAPLVPDDPTHRFSAGVPSIWCELSRYFEQKDIIHCVLILDGAPYHIHAYFMRDVSVLGTPRPQDI